VYQIVMAVRDFLPDEMSVGIENVGRGDIEKAGSLSFLGFINFKNLLKEDTRGVIEELHGGGVRIIMVTGDNLYTGIKIATECGLIRTPKALVGQVEDSQVVRRDGQSEAMVARPPPGFQELEELKASLAGSGDAWTALRSERSPLCGYIEVIGRCTPNHKVFCIDYYVQRGPSH
jgi:cation-transporting ATPase 13A3/4/5